MAGAWRGAEVGIDGSNSSNSGCTGMEASIAVTSSYPPEVQSAIDRAVAAKQAHEAALFKIPGVHGVSVEPKTVKGVRTAEFAVVVHVEHKAPVESLSPGEVIPPTLDGVSTDVIEAARAVLLAGGPDDQDTNHYATLVGGVAILSATNKSFDGSRSNSAPSGLIVGSGTLGCIAINTSATDPSKKAVALSNAHVLFKPSVSVKQTGAAVGQTEICSSCCKSFDHTIGHVDHDGVYNGYDSTTSPPSPPNGVDAAFATLDPGVKWSAAVITSGEGGSITTEPVAGAHPVGAAEALFNTTTTPPTPIYPVHKRGSRTRFTSGWLISITYTSSIDTTLPDGTKKTLIFPNQLKIISQDNTLYFDDHGDSGSVVLNTSHQVVGLVRAAAGLGNVATSFGAACPIADVQTLLGVVIADATTYPGVQTVPPAPAAAPAVAALPASQAAMRERMAVVRAELTTTEVGQELDAAVHRHFGELRGLVDVNKRAAAVWRRVSGPAWIGEALSCMMDRRRRFPSELEGRSLNDCMDQFAQVLQRYGSQSLIADMRRYEPRIRALAGRTFDELLAALRESVTV
jgi:hypothetical protein